MINLQELAERLQKAKLINKSFFECTRAEILEVCEAVLSSVGEEVPPGGWASPYIDNGELIVPVDVHPSEKWWKPGGKSIKQVLMEIDAPFEVARKYINWPGKPPLTAEQWEEMKKVPA